jgi:hypothetical protein
MTMVLPLRLYSSWGILSDERTGPSFISRLVNCHSIFTFLHIATVYKKSRDSSVGTTLGYGLDDWGSRVRFLTGAGNYSLHRRVQNGSGAHPASYPRGTRGFFLGGKAEGREADHSPPSSVEIKNAWSYTSSPQRVFMAWCLVKHRDNFTFYLFTVYKVPFIKYTSCRFV